MAYFNNIEPRPTAVMQAQNRETVTIPNAIDTPACRPDESDVAMVANTAGPGIAIVKKNAVQPSNIAGIWFKSSSTVGLIEVFYQRCTNAVIDPVYLMLVNSVINTH